MSAYVYRLYDAQGDLLYVGYTANSVAVRLNSNRNRRVWGHLIAHHTYETFATPAEAYAAEGEAIRTEEPRYNEARTTKRPMAPATGGNPDGDPIERVTHKIAQSVRDHGLNETTLAEVTGIPLHRVRRHLAHAGKCRMSEVYTIAKALGVPATHFFEVAS